MTHTRGVSLSRVCVFCGSSTGNRDDYRTSTTALAAELIRRGCTAGRLALAPASSEPKWLTSLAES